jgi:hypothetical protein
MRRLGNRIIKGKVAWIGRRKMSCGHRDGMFEARTYGVVSGSIRDGGCDRTGEVKVVSNMDLEQVKVGRLCTEAGEDGKFIEYKSHSVHASANSKKSYVSRAGNENNIGVWRSK